MGNGSWTGKITPLGFRGLRQQFPGYLVISYPAIKKNINEQVTLKQIIREELEKEGILNESFEQLDEFAMWNKIKSKVKGISSNILNAVKRIYDGVMKRISEAFNYIKTLGEKIISGLMNFLGITISKIKISGGGRFPL
jgi:hypothetical protein